MRSAIALIWLSLFWTLLCFLFYRDRELIFQASLPVWIASAVAWIIYRTVVSLAGRRARKCQAAPEETRGIQSRLQRPPNHPDIRDHTAKAFSVDIRARQPLPPLGEGGLVPSQIQPLPPLGEGGLVPSQIQPLSLWERVAEGRVRAPQ